MPYSHHSHSGQFCRHATGRLADIVQKAIDEGFEVYGLTEHVPRYRREDLYPEEHGLDIAQLGEQFRWFVEEAHALKRQHSEITLLVGLETEYITDIDLDRLDALLAEHGPRIQFLIGSVHHVGGVAIDFDEATFRQALEGMGNERETFLGAYFDAQYELLRRFLPEVVGHFDLCRLYEPSLRFADYPSVQTRVERNLRFAIAYGAVFELNAAALSKQWPTPYPGPDVVQLILSLGGRFVLSDDSHGVDRVGRNYGALGQYLQAMGINELWCLREATEPNRAGRPVQAVRVPGAWWAHPFWSARGLQNAGPEPKVTECPSV